MSNKDLEQELNELQLMTLEQIVDFGLRLKRAADGTERLLIMFLRRVETQCEHIWQPDTGKGPADFGTFLRLHMNIEPARYEQGLKAVIEISATVIDQIGMVAAKQAVHFSDPAQREKMLESCQLWVTEHSPIVPARTAVQLASAVAGSINPVPTRVDKLRASLAELHAARVECHQLKQKLAKVTEERDALIAQLRERSGDEQSPAVARKKNGREKGPKAQPGTAATT